MNTGKTLFAQLMDFLPWTTFTRIVDRYGGDHRVRTLSCAVEWIHGFAQKTYRGLRDARPASREVHASKLSMGLPAAPALDAGDARDWRIHAALAQRLITQARTLYVDEELGLDLTNTDALDDRRPSLCACRSFRGVPHHQGGGRRCTRCSTWGQHSEPHLGASCTTFMPSICSCRKPEPSTSWIVASVEPAFMCCTKPGPSSSRVPSRTSMLIDYSAPTDRSTGMRPTISWTASTPVRITPNFCGASASSDPRVARPGLHRRNNQSRFRPPSPLDGAGHPFK